MYNKYIHTNVKGGAMAFVRYYVGDVVKMKKSHPCGSDEWEVIKVGADIKLKCCGCMHEIILKRSLVEKNTKKIQKSVNNDL